MRRGDAGVTLVEVLVVLVLIGVMAGAVGLSLGSVGQSDTLAREADLLTARLHRAADEVVLTGAPVAFVWSADGYRFEIAGPEGWIPHPVAILGTPHPLDIATATQTEGRFEVTQDLLPLKGAPLELTLRDRPGSTSTVRFDGITAVRDLDP